MKRTFCLSLLVLFSFLNNAWSMAVDDPAPDFVMAKQPSMVPHAKVELGFGLLDDKGITGSSGTPVFANFGMSFEPLEHLEATVIFPLAGTWSGGPDDFGIGNITLELKHLSSNEGLNWGIGSEIFLPTAQSGSHIGEFTRHFVRYIEDQFALSPFLLLSYAKDRMMVSFDVSADLQIYTSTPAGLDQFEALIGYDTGIGYAVADNYWATIEFGGHSAISFDEDTQFFGGAGFHYKDYQFSTGATIMAPFTGPSNDAIDLMVMFDLRLMF